MEKVTDDTDIVFLGISPKGDRPDFLFRLEIISLHSSLAIFPEIEEAATRRACRLRGRAATRGATSIATFHMPRFVGAATAAFVLFAASVTAVYEEPVSAVWEQDKRCGVCVPITGSESAEKDFVMKKKEFMPAPLKHMETCRAINPAATLFQKQLAYITGESCALHRHFRPRAMENGFGATMMSMIKPVMHALTYGYCIDKPKKMKKWSSRDCAGWQCFFKDVGRGLQSLPNASAVGANLMRSHESAVTGLISEAKDDKAHCVTWWEKQYDADEDINTELQEDCAIQFSYNLLGESTLPPAFRKLGLFFYVSQATYGFYGLAKKVEDRIISKKRRIGFPKYAPTIGLHVRLGDACIKSEHAASSHGRKCNQLVDFMPHVKRVSEQYGIKNIYLATDSKKVLSDTRTYPQYNWIFDNSTRRGGVLNHHAIEYALEHNLINGYQEGLGVIDDLWLLADCDALVGKFTSNIDRVAYQIMTGRSNCYRPYISMDSSWCFDHGLKTGHSDVGSFWC